MIDQATRTHLEGWKLSLLDLSSDNRLIDLSPEHSCLAIAEVDVVRLADALAGGAAFTLTAGATALEGGRLGVALAAPELTRRLVAMRRSARARLADDGEHTLWLAHGLLTWHDATGAAHVAPLALQAVELERAAEVGTDDARGRVLSGASDGALRLIATAERELCFNHTLGERLRRDLGLVIDVPQRSDSETADEGAVDLRALFESVAALAVTRPGWRVDAGARLGLFSFARLAMWRDLERLDDQLAPVLAHLAAATGQPFPRADAAAGELLAPLDADGSQLTAVAAAGAGDSFVLQGAPGTGKSQTIANLVVHCVSQGKSVLVVSHKRTALEVVHQRLAAIGLDQLCLELHAHATSRRDVLGQLGRVLDRSFRPGAGSSNQDARLVELRGVLDGYVAALHRVGPLGRSLHEVLGRLVELRSTPRAALADPDVVGLDAATFARRMLAVEQLAAAAVPVEPVATHAWRASTLARWPLEGREHALGALAEAATSVDQLAVAVREVTALIPHVIARTAAQLEALGALAALAATTPRPGAELLTQLRAPRAEQLGEQIALIRARGTGTIEVPRDPAAFLAVASRHRALALEVDDRFTTPGLLEPRALWSQLRKWTGSVAPLRYVALRTARAEVRARAHDGQLLTDEAMIDGLEAVIAERACRAALIAAAEPARRWFGELGGDPLALDLARIDAAVGWAGELRRAFDTVELTGGEAGRAAAWRALVAQVAASPTAPQLIASDDSLAVFGRVATAVEHWRAALAALARSTGIPSATLGIGDDQLTALGERCAALGHAIDGFRDWVAFHGARRLAREAGIGPAAIAIDRGDLGAAELAGAWERATLLAWADAELAETPALAGFHGAAHHAQVSAFADLDRGSLALARARAVVRLAERVPRSSEPGGDELAILRAEIARSGLLSFGPERGGAETQSREPTRSLRQLFAALPTVLPRLAPCLLMSPRSVARYLDPAMRFDVVVFDEASQLATAEAIGALARGRAAIIVGDVQQLAPDGASLLDDCIAARLPQLHLATHYRSRHEDLFAFANRRYYGDRLTLFPAAHGSPDLGVAWRAVEPAGEVAAIVAEVQARLHDPAQRQRSLGVVTFGAAQQAQLEELLDSDEVSVKTVEAAQGDERDVILVAGSGATERGLVVALTRAREQLVVFASDDEVVADAPAAQRDLAAFIAFARAGGGAARPTEDVPASPITAAIGRALGERGWSVRHQVGCGPYKIDLAVVDPTDADRYVLAIEHDGTAYAGAPAPRGQGHSIAGASSARAEGYSIAGASSARAEGYSIAGASSARAEGYSIAGASSARDRDRLRAQVLGQLGWRTHRIWTLDWWADPEREVQRVHGAIVAAIAASRRQRPDPARDSARVAVSRVAKGSTRVAAAAALADGSGPSPIADGPTTPVKIPRGSIAIGPYTTAAIPSGRRMPDDMFAPRHLAELGKVVEQVLAAEAPMSLELLARRVGAYFGIGRVTQRVTDQVRLALAGRGKWGDEQNIVWRLDQDPAAVPAVRVAGSTAQAHRDIDEVPLSELAAAARIVVERGGASDLVRDVARLLGFARITERVTDRIGRGVRLATARELIRVADGKASLPAE